MALGVEGSEVERRHLGSATQARKRGLDTGRRERGGNLVLVLEVEGLVDDGDVSGVAPQDVSVERGAHIEEGVLLECGLVLVPVNGASDGGVAVLEAVG